MSARVLIDYGPIETLAALQQHDTITRLWVGPGYGVPLPAMPGERLSGRIRTIDKRLGAAFVELQGGEEGFLTLPGKQQLSEGQALIVEVKHPARGGKLASLRLSPDQKPVSGERESPVHFALKALSAEAADIAIHAPLQQFLSLKSSLVGEMVQVSREGLDEQGLGDAIERALSRSIDLPSGVRLTLDQAEALTAVDIDTSSVSGQSKVGAVAKACETSIPAILSQLSLRGISGQVVIDFPVTRRDGAGIEKALKAAIEPLSGWRAHRLSDAGLVALIIPRTGWSLQEYLTEPGEDAPVAGRIFTTRHLAAEALRAAERALAANRAAKLALILPPAVHELVAASPSWLDALFEAYGERLTLKTDTDRQGKFIDVRPIS